MKTLSTPLEIKIMKYQSFLVSALISIALPSCDTSERDFKKAEAANTEQALEGFIAKHPNGPLQAQAKAKLARLAFENAKKFSTPEAISGFLARFPDSDHTAKANVLLEEVIFKAASKDPSVDALRAYLTKYPNSHHAEQASAQLATLEDRIDYETAAKTNSVEGFEKYLKKHPTGEHAKQSRERINEIKFANLKANQVWFEEGDYILKRGEMRFALGGNTPGQETEDGMTIVFICSSEKMAKQLDLKSGCAYLVGAANGKRTFNYIRKIDPKLSQEKILSLFGVE